MMDTVKKYSWLRVALPLLLLAAITAVFIYYFVHHPNVRHQLAAVPPLALALVFLLSLCNVGAVALTFIATLRLCGVQLRAGESVVVTAYSSLINFFGPLQSGTIFRGAYFKKKHGVSIKDYTFATAVYYGFYALFSGLFLLSRLLGWWLALLVAVTLVAAFLAARTPKGAAVATRLNKKALLALAGATFIQVALFALTYFVELRSVQPDVHIWQAVVYSGAANLALFVSLTPGAIGFREAFLVFSEKLHHISGNTIVAANVIDRSVFIVALLLMALLLFTTHTRDHLRADARQ